MVQAHTQENTQVKNLFDMFNDLTAEDREHFQRMLANHATESSYDNSLFFYKGLEKSKEEQERFALQLEVQKLRELAYRDPLSGLHNKGKYIEYIKELKKEKVNFSIVVFDFNNLKKLNDTYGHSVADNVIRLVAKRMKNAISSKDNLFHWGGDEFVLVTKNSLKNTINIAKRVQKAVYTDEILVNGISFHIKVSAGASFCPHWKEAEETFEEADKNMYANKTMLKSGYDFNGAFVAQVNSTVQISQRAVQVRLTHSTKKTVRPEIIKQRYSGKLSLA